jgi:hypothetical protein
MTAEYCANSGDLMSDDVAPFIPEKGPSELELDILVAYDLATGSPAGRLMWAAVGWSPPPGVNVERQTRRHDRRTTDVEARATTSPQIRLLCEDKLADGVFQDDQLLSYAKEVQEHPHTAAIVIAPRVRLKHLNIPPALKSVAVEDLADELQRGADELQELERQDARRLELAAGYRHRARRLRALCESKVSTPNEAGAAFRSAYNEVALARTEGRVQLGEKTLGFGGGFAAFKPGQPAPKGFKLTHKLTQGVIDLEVRGWELSALERHLAALTSEEHPPEGWGPAKQQSSDVPVLRFVVQPLSEDVGQMTQEGAENAARAIAPVAVRAVDELGIWLAYRGAQVFERPTEKTLHAQLARACETASEIGRPEVAEQIRHVVAALVRD